MWNKSNNIECDHIASRVTCMMLIRSILRGDKGLLELGTNTLIVLLVPRPQPEGLCSVAVPWQPQRPQQSR